MSFRGAFMYQRVPVEDLVRGNAATISVIGEEVLARRRFVQLAKAPCLRPRKREGIY